MAAAAAQLEVAADQNAVRRTGGHAGRIPELSSRKRPALEDLARRVEVPAPQGVAVRCSLLPHPAASNRGKKRGSGLAARHVLT